MHDIDRVDIKLASDARRRLVLGEGQHADARHEIDDGIRIADRRRVRPLAARIVGRVVGAILRQTLIERIDDGVEVARLRVEGQHERSNLGAKEVVGAGGSERCKGPEIARIDEFLHRRRIGEVSDPEARHVGQRSTELNSEEAANFLGFQVGLLRLRDFA